MVRNMSEDIFDRLFEVIESRKARSPEESYVSKLMHKGVAKMNSKILEEAGEVCDAAVEGEKTHLVYELCDLLFHAFVLAGYAGITIDDLRAELERRFGTSGLEEKASRRQK